MRRIAMAATLTVAACGPGVSHGTSVADVDVSHRRYEPGRDIETSTSIVTAPAITARAARSAGADGERAAPHVAVVTTEPAATGTTVVTYAAQPPQHPLMRLSSTAFCETGRMANGQRTHRGAVAGNRWPLGTRLQVSDSPYGPGVFVVQDRIGHGSDLDFATPGDCAAARRWGRRSVTVQAAP